MGPFSTALQGTFQGVGVEQPGLELVVIWDVDVAGSTIQCLLQCVIVTIRYC